MTGKEMTDEEIYAFIKERGEDEIGHFTGVIVALAISHNLEIERVRDIAFVVAQDFIKEHQEDIAITGKYNDELKILLNGMLNDILGGNPNDISN